MTDYLRYKFVSFQQRCQISHDISGSARSDLVMPLSGWRGDDPIDEDRLNLLFGHCNDDRRSGEGERI